MRKVFHFILSISLLLFVTINATAQNIPPTNWSVEVSEIETKVNDTIELIFTATLPKGVHIYANDFICNPIMADIIIDPNPSILAPRKPIAIGTHRVMDEIFECEINEWQDKAEFRQKIKIIGTNPTISGTLEYQMCLEDGSCVLHEYKFQIAIKTK
jgi:DsbC/DsbD-like thiol-disulfide interchange protein